MKVKTIYWKDEKNDSWGERESYQLIIDGKEQLNVGRMEPEDVTLNRELDFVFRIPSLMLAAYEAGKRGEELELEGEERAGREGDDDDDD